MLTFVYFCYVDPSTEGIGARPGWFEITYSVVAFAALAGVGYWLGRRWTRPLQQYQGGVSNAETRRRALLVPFLLDGVAGVSRLNQGDGMHPNDAGEKIVAENVWRSLKPVLDSLDRTHRGG